MKGNISGIFFGFSQCILYVIAGIVFYLGAIFIHSHNISVSDVFTSTYAIILAGVTIGNNAHFMPDIEAAKISAVNIFLTLDAEDEDQLQVKS
jgi:ABC-type multidrug transport system fused ATPase/permease subunit